MSQVSEVAEASGARSSGSRSLRLSQLTKEFAAFTAVKSLDLEVPIYAGTSAAVLNRGAGLIEGTALPGDDGNIGSGHRDRCAAGRATVGDQAGREWTEAGVGSGFPA